MDVVAPFGGGKQVVQDVRARELAGEDVNVMAPDAGGSGVTHQTLQAGDSEGSAQRGSAAGAPAPPERK
jgi:hypothetical protein